MRGTMTMVIGVALGVWLLGALALAEADSEWVGATGNWFDASNWQGGILPTSSTTTHIANGGTARIAAPTARAYYLRLGFGVGTTGRLELSAGGQLEAGDERVGSTHGAGTFIQSGGTNTVRYNLGIASLEGAVGTYELRAGELSVKGLITVGHYHGGNGTFTQSGGTNTIGDGLIIGCDWSASAENTTGMYTMSGGQLSTKHLLVSFNGHQAQEGGIGTLKITDPGAGITVSGRLHFGGRSTVTAVPGSALHITGTGAQPPYNNVYNYNTDPTKLAGFANLEFIYENGTGFPYRVEVAGQDLGPVMAGFTGNFEVGTLRLGGTSPGSIQLVDDFDNRPTSADSQALYVRNLHIGAGSRLDLNGLTLYYLNGSIHPEATIELNGGSLVRVGAAGPVFFAGTGHYYELIEQWGIGWDDAKTAAEARSHLGSPGHLVTITSQAENDFIRDTVLGTAVLDHYWVGGYQPENSPEPGGNWQWITGEAWTYQNWNGGEPNNVSGGDEDVLMVYSGVHQSRYGKWNDAPRAAADWVGGYIVEYEVLPPVNTPPTAEAGGPYSVAEGASVTVTGSGSDPEGGPLSFAWDLDHDGIFETPGQSVPFSATGLDGPSIHTIAVQVTNNGGLSSTDETTVEVQNVAPSLGPITAPMDPVQAGTVITASASFTDPGVLDTHTAVWQWGDGTTDTIELGGSGAANGSHTYDAPGVYTLTLKVTDKDGDFDVAQFQYVVVYDPCGGFVTGGGWIMSPLGAYVFATTITGKANFGFVAKYVKGADVPEGQTEFHFRVLDLHFHSTAYQWLVVAGAKAQFKGTGRLNGEDGYGFMLTAVDGQINGGGGTDKFRIKIWNGDGVVHDNKVGEDDTSDAATEIGGGSIVIHKE